MDQTTATLKGLELLSAWADEDHPDDIEFLKERLVDTAVETGDVQQTLILSFSGVMNVAGLLLELHAETTGQSPRDVLHHLSLQVQGKPG